MTTTALQLRITCAAAALICAAPAAPAHADEATRAPVQQLVAMLGPFDTAVAPGTSFAWSAALPHGGMLHGVVVELVDGAGRRFEGSPTWSAAVSGGDVAALPLMERMAAVRVLALPRPLGMRIEAGDSVVVRGELLATDAATPLYIRVTVDYEMLTGPLSRLAVVPLHLRLAGADSVSDASSVARAWQAPVDGRVMMLVGLPAHVGGVLRLEDAETGATLWHETLRPAGGAGFGRDDDGVRIGAMVQAGRSYRVTLQGAGQDRIDGGMVHVLLAPVRTVAAHTARN